MKGKLILIIEDDPLLLKSMAGNLVEAGAEVMMASDGKAGLEKFGRLRPDLVITDIIMPEKEGIETIMTIKAMAPDLPVIAISGGGRVGPTEFLQLALGLGADAALAKPFRGGELVAAAANILSPKAA